MAEFAEMIGCRQSTVSRYESGKLIPSRTVLLLLLQLAEDSERQPILQALGVTRSLAQSWKPSDLADALRTFDAYLAAAGPAADRNRGRAPQGSALAEFARLAARIVSERHAVEPAVVEVLRLWLKHRTNRKARKYFRHIAAYLEVELSVLKASELRNAAQGVKGRDHPLHR